MRTFSLFITDTPYTVPSLVLIVAGEDHSAEMGDLVSGRHQGQQHNSLHNRPNTRPYPTNRNP